MRTAKLFVSLACALVLLIAKGDAQSLCTTKTYGYKVGADVKLDDVYLKPGVAAWNVSIPNQCSSEMGVLLTACDYDAQPDIDVKSLVNAIITRRGSLNGYAQLSTKLYCVDSKLLLISQHP